MRDINRLDKFYSQLCEIHKKSFPDMREGQFLINVFDYIRNNYSLDPFFLESEELLKFIKDYVANFKVDDSKLAIDCIKNLRNKTSIEI